jgi:hypothetical protein
MPGIVQIACLEDWFTNYRLLIEFLVIGPPANCASAKDLVADWSPQAEGEHALRRDYGVASESVSHIGKARPAEPGEVDPEGLRSKATRLFTVLETFVDALDQDDPYTEMLRSELDDARAVLASQV